MSFTTADLYDEHGEGEQDVPVTFGGATFSPGDQVYADDDGVAVLSATA
jgi:regulator of ribonuclease activity A